MYHNNGSALAYTGVAGGVLGALLGVALAFVVIGVVLCVLAMGPRIALEPVRSDGRRRLRMTFNGRLFRRRSQ